MNNEPVAWMDSVGELIPTELLPWFEENGYTHIPLYTHPSKDLTDEEIEEVKNSCRTEMKEWGNISFIDFARAILKEANEK